MSYASLTHIDIASLTHIDITSMAHVETRRVNDARRGASMAHDYVNDACRDIASRAFKSYMAFGPAIIMGRLGLCAYALACTLIFTFDIG